MAGRSVRHTGAPGDAPESNMPFPTTDFALFLVVVFVLHWLLNPHHTPWKWFILRRATCSTGGGTRRSWLLALVSTMAWGSALWVEERRTTGSAGVGPSSPPSRCSCCLAWFALRLLRAEPRERVRLDRALATGAAPAGAAADRHLVLHVHGDQHVVDVSRYEIVPSKWLDVSVYLAFFPHLIAGPIVRGDELIPQIRRACDLRRIDASRALLLIFAGLFKKIVISSFLASRSSTRSSARRTRTAASRSSSRSTRTRS